MSARLVEALESRDADDKCWSWHETGYTVGWVRRRQAHETLIHRVDAELAAGGLFNVDAALAADGVDEILRVHLDVEPLPDWATYEPDGATAIIDIEDDPASWTIDLGRFMGTNPGTGKVHNDPALRFVDTANRPSSAIRGSGTDVDLWLWGRGPLDPLTVEGNLDVVHQIRATAAYST